MIRRSKIRISAALRSVGSGLWSFATLGCNAALDNHPRQVTDPAHEATETGDPVDAAVSSDDDATATELGMQSDDNTTQAAPDIPGEMSLWLAADQGVTTDGDGAVTTWADRSGHDRNATPPNPDAAPHRRASEDPLQPLVFDGDDELSLPSFPAFSELSFFAVARALESSQGPRCPSILHLSNVDVGVRQVDDVEFGRHQRELYYEVERGSVTAGPASAGSFPVAVWHLLGVTHAASGGAVLRVDGRQTGEAELDVLASVVRNSNFIGNNHYFFDAARPQCDGYLGEIAEILLYPRALSDGERERVERYLDEKWQVGVF